MDIEKRQMQPAEAEGDGNEAPQESLDDQLKGIEEAIAALEGDENRDKEDEAQLEELRAEKKRLEGELGYPESEESLQGEMAQAVDGLSSRGEEGVTHAEQSLGLDAETVATARMESGVEGKLAEVVAEAKGGTRSEIVEEEGGLEKAEKMLVEELAKTLETIKNDKTRRQLKDVLDSVLRRPGESTPYLNQFLREPRIEGYLPESAGRDNEEVRKIFGRDAKEVKSRKDNYLSSECLKEIERRQEAVKPPELKQRDQLLEKRTRELFLGDTIGLYPSLLHESDLDTHTLGRTGKKIMDISGRNKQELLDMVRKDRMEIFKIFHKATPEEYDRRTNVPVGTTEKNIGRIDVGSWTEGGKWKGERQLQEEFQRKKNDVFTAAEEEFTQKALQAAERWEKEAEKARLGEDFVNDAAVIESNKARFGAAIREAVGMYDKKKIENKEAA